KLRTASGGTGGRPAATRAWLSAGARSRFESTSVPSRSNPTIWKGNWAIGDALAQPYGNGNRMVAWRAHMSDKPEPSSRPVAAIVLAAGKGTRMKSQVHKVLHTI